MRPENSGESLTHPASQACFCTRACIHIHSHTHTHTHLLLCALGKPVFHHCCVIELHGGG
jgi:hypothetical protein